MTAERRDADMRVFRQIYPPARQFAAFVAGAGIEPDDLVQEALARVLARGALSDLSEPLAYLRTTMLNIVRNEHRRRGREHAALARLRPHGTGETIDGDRFDATDDVVAVLHTLPPAARAAVFLVDLEGMPMAEAGALLGLSATATRARLSRARRALREQTGRTREETA